MDFFLKRVRDWIFDPFPFDNSPLISSLTYDLIVASVSTEQVMPDRADRYISRYGYNGQQNISEI